MGIMKKTHGYLLLSFIIAGLCFQVNAKYKDVEVTGVITTKSGTPIAGACIGLSSSNRISNAFDTLWSLVDTTYTDSLGKFSKNIIVNEYALGIRYVASFKGYKTKNGYGKIDGDRINLGSIKMTSTGQKRITSHGRVVDGAGNPLSGVTVLLSGGVIIDTVYLVNGPYDSAVTDYQGNFSKDMRINSDLFRIIYLAGKKGYRTVRGFKEIIGISNKVNIGTITLPAPTNRKVTVLGKVVDIKTGAPVTDALVTASSSSIVVTDLDSAFTNQQGNFTITIDIDNSGIVKPVVTYGVYKLGYFPKNGTARELKDTVNLGTIKLTDDGTPITQYPVLGSHKPDNMAVYSLKGQLLYSGKIIDIRKRLIARFGRQPVVIFYKKDNVLLFQRKYTELK